MVFFCWIAVRGMWIEWLYAADCRWKRAHHMLVKLGSHRYQTPLCSFNHKLKAVWFSFSRHLFSSTLFHTRIRFLKCGPTYFGGLQFSALCAVDADVALDGLQFEWIDVWLLINVLSNCPNPKPSKKNDWSQQSAPVEKKSKKQQKWNHSNTKGLTWHIE